MGHWNHRVIRQIHNGEQSFGIHEVFYGLDGGTGWTNDPVGVIGESLEDLRETLERMMACLDKPVIDDLPEGEK